MTYHKNEMWEGWDGGRREGWELDKSSNMARYASSALRAVLSQMWVSKKLYSKILFSTLVWGPCDDDGEERSSLNEYFLVSN